MLRIGVPRIVDPQVSTQQHHRILCRCYPVVPRSLGGGLKYFVEFQPYLGKNKNILTFHIFFRMGWWKTSTQVLQKTSEKEKKQRFPGFLGFLDVSKERWRQQQTSLVSRRDDVSHHGELCTVERGQLILGGWWPLTDPTEEGWQNPKNPKRAKKAMMKQTAIFKEGGVDNSMFFFGGGT